MGPRKRARLLVIRGALDALDSVVWGSQILLNSPVAFLGPVRAAVQTLLLANAAEINTPIPVPTPPCQKCLNAKLN